MWQSALLSLVMFFFFSSAVKAEGLVVRALLPNPETGSEWIAIENTSSASQSAVGFAVRDGAGSIKSFSLSGEWAAGEVRLLPQTTTKISLNNDLDWVELVGNGIVTQMTEIYEAAPKGHVWFLGSNGWQFISLSEWEERAGQKNWSVVGESTPVPSASPEPMSSVLPSYAPRPSPKPSPSANASPVVSPPSGFSPVPTDFPFGVPQLMPGASVSAEVWISPSPSFPEDPDWEEEQKRLLAWRFRFKAWSSLLLFSGSICFLVTVPRLVRCYNDLTSCLVPFDSL